MLNCTVVNVSAAGDGGAVWASGGAGSIGGAASAAVSVNLVGSSFQNVSSAGGNGGAVFGAMGVFAAGCSVADAAAATGRGGAFYSLTYVEANSTQFANCTAIEVRAPRCARTHSAASTDDAQGRRLPVK